jgi:hypothetical protein
MKDPFTAAYLGNLWRANDQENDHLPTRKPSKNR